MRIIPFVGFRFKSQGNGRRAPSSELLADGLSRWRGVLVPLGK